MGEKNTKQLMAYSLTSDDLMRLFNGQVKILSYPELLKFTSIDELLSPYGKVIILYLTKGNNYGHWTAINKVGNVISFFDSYGTFPDNMLYYKHNKGAQASGTTIIPHLTKLLYKSPNKYRFQYNDKQLQEYNDKIATCGRHVASFLAYNKPVDDYIKIFEKLKMRPDLFVTELTNNIG